MKGNKKVLVIAVLLLLISVTLTTYAIYKTSYSGNGSASAAAWTVAFTNGATSVSDNFTLTFGAGDCNKANDGTNDHVADGKIAPGVTCTKTISVDATGTEVDVLLTGTITSGGSITATKNSSPVSLGDADIDVSVTTNVTDNVITYDAATKTATVTVTLTWDADENTDDTSLAGATFTVPITLTAKQYLGS